MRPTRRLVFAQILLGGFIESLLARRAAYAETVDYTYDELGRLTRAAYENGCVIDYTYDPAGNRTALDQPQCTAPPGPPPPPPPPPGFNATIQITGTSPVNLRTLANSAGYNGAEDAHVLYQLASNITITGAAGAPSTPGGAGISTGTWPTGSQTIELTLQISGKVRGGGGNGGAGNGGAGSAGGDAIACQAPVSITVNAGGEVRGGGGGAGAGGRGRQNAGGEFFLYGGGGGGGGAPNGPGGAGGTATNGNGAGGSAGTNSGGGAGGAGSDGIGGDGGAGGGFAASGAAGETAFNAGGAGAAGGYAIRKNGHTVPVTNNGTITGTVG